MLTFDDGPGRDATAAVLEELHRVQVQATFFVLGKEVLRNPRLAREIVGGGHEIALHGHDHQRYDKLTPAGTSADLQEGLRAIEQVTGQRAHWFRPPFGRLPPQSASVVTDLGLQVVYWSCWGLDWEDTSAEAIEREVVGGLAAGAIVLLHDNAAYGRRSSALATARAVGPIVDHGRARGWSWTTLADAVSDDPGF